MEAGEVATLGGCASALLNAARVNPASLYSSSSSVSRLLVSKRLRPHGSLLLPYPLIRNFVVQALPLVPRGRVRTRTVPTSPGMLFACGAEVESHAVGVDLS